MAVRQVNQATVRIGALVGVLTVIAGCTSSHSPRADSQTKVLETQTGVPDATSSGVAYPTATPSNPASAPPFVTDRSQRPAMVLLAGSVGFPSNRGGFLMPRPVG